MHKPGQATKFHTAVLALAKEWEAGHITFTTYAAELRDLAIKSLGNNA